jgi:hypothetical protein
MKGERSLFPLEQLVSEETRKKWEDRLDFLSKHLDLLDEYQVTFVKDWLVKIGRGEDMNFNQSSFLNRTFHRVEEAVG